MNPVRNLLSDLWRILLIDKLVQVRAARTKQCLARELYLSESRMESLLRSLRESGLPIVYDSREKAFVYTKDMRFIVRVECDGDVLFDYDSEGVRMQPLAAPAKNRGPLKNEGVLTG